MPSGALRFSRVWSKCERVIRTEMALCGLREATVQQLTSSSPLTGDAEFKTTVKKYRRAQGIVDTVDFGITKSTTAVSPSQ